MTSTNSTHTVNGQQRVRVTRVLRDLYDFAGVSREVLDRAADRGSKADRAIMLYTQNNLDEATLDPVLVPYLAGWKKAVDHYGINVLAYQRRVVHSIYQYAGTIDLVLEMTGPPKHVHFVDLVVADLKCVDTVMPVAALQLAAYQAALNHELANMAHTGTSWCHSIALRRASHRLVIQLTQDGEFVPHWCTDENDFTVFMGCLHRLNWRVRHGLEQL